MVITYIERNPELTFYNPKLRNFGLIKATENIFIKRGSKKYKKIHGFIKTFVGLNFHCLSFSHFPNISSILIDEIFTDKVTYVGSCGILSTKTCMCNPEKLELCQDIYCKNQKKQ